QLAAQTLPPLGRIDAAHQLTAHAAVAVHAGVDVDGGEADQIPAAAQGEAVALQVEPGHGEPFADAGLLRRLAALVGPVDAVQQRRQRGDVVEGEGAAGRRDVERGHRSSVSSAGAEGAERRYTLTWLRESAVKAVPSQSAQRASREKPDSCAIRSSSAGHT